MKIIRRNVKINIRKVRDINEKSSKWGGYSLLNKVLYKIEFGATSKTIDVVFSAKKSPPLYENIIKELEEIK